MPRPVTEAERKFKLLRAVDKHNEDDTTSNNHEAQWVAIMQHVQYVQTPPTCLMLTPHQACMQ